MFLMNTTEIAYNVRASRAAATVSFGLTGNASVPTAG